MDKLITLAAIVFAPLFAMSVSLHSPPALATPLAAITGDPSDHGGATNWGITVADVRGLGSEEAKAIYRTAYWLIVRGRKLPRGVDLVRAVATARREGCCPVAVAR